MAATVFRMSSQSGQVTGTPGDSSLFYPFSEAPAGFFSTVSHEDGGDIRIRTGAGENDPLVPFRVVGFSKAKETGGVWVYFEPLSGSNVDLYCHLGDSANTIWDPQVWELTVTNPSAATNTSGWTSTLGTLGRITSGPTGGPNQPYLSSAGAYFFGGTTTECRAHQDLTFDSSHNTAVDAGERAFRVEWLQASFSTADNDDAEMEVEFFNGSAVSLGARVGSQLLRVTPQDWELQRWQIDVPATTRTIRLSMHIDRNDGTNNNGYIHSIRAFLVERSPTDGWAAFEDAWEHCYLGGVHGLEDMTGRRMAMARGPLRFSNELSRSGGTGADQGVCIDRDDPETVYTSATNLLEKWTYSPLAADGSYVGASLVTTGVTNTDPVGDAGIVTNKHMADIEIYTHGTHGKVIAGIVINFNGTSGSGAQLAWYDPDDLTYIDQVDISAHGSTISGSGYQPDEHRLYVIHWHAQDNAKCREIDYYDADTGAYEGTLLTSTDLIRAQGIVWVPSLGKWKVTTGNSGGEDATWLVAPDGTCEYASEGGTTVELEGISHNATNTVYLFNNTAAKVLVEFDDGMSHWYGGGIGFPAQFSSGAQQRFMFTPRNSQTFSMGISYNLTTLGEDRALMSFVVNDNGTDANRTTLQYQHSTTKIGLYNSTDGVRVPASTTYTAGTLGRAYGVHEASVNQKLYVNGVLEATTTPGSNRPVAGADRVYVGTADGDFTQKVIGEVGGIVFSLSPKSADYIATEWACLSSPSTFWDTGDLEEPSTGSVRLVDGGLIGAPITILRRLTWPIAFLLTLATRLAMRSWTTSTRARARELSRSARARNRRTSATPTRARCSAR